MSEPARRRPPAKRKPTGPTPGERSTATPASVVVERVQTGLRIEKRMLKVLKALAEYHDIGLGDLVEGIVLHAFDGRCAFGPDSVARIAAIKDVYGLDLDSTAAHRLVESDAASARPSA